MITFGQQQTRFFDITKTDPNNSNDSARAIRMLNDKNQEILGLRDWYFLEKERSATFVADQSEYGFPVDYAILKALWVEVGGVKYTPIEVTDLEQWQNLNSTTVSSDITSHFYILEDSLRLYPIPSSTNGTIHIVYRRKDRDMSASDYTTGTISSTAGSTTITGSGTTWTSAMVGRYINLNGRWYEISGYSSATGLSLTKPTLDTVSGASYTIGEASSIPSEFQDLIWKGAAADFYDFKGDSNPWRNEYEKRLILFIKRYGSDKKTTGQVLRPFDRNRVSLVNPNDYPTGLS